MAEEKNLIDSLEVGRDRVKVNMLQYVDDTLFFCEVNTESIFNIKTILQCFELASGLRVNFVKSRIGGTGLSHGSLRSFANILKCDVMGSPFVYLGLPVGGSHKRGDFWNGVIEKVKTRLSRWKGKSLLFAGRVCFDQVCSFFHPVILYVTVYIAFRGGRQVGQDSKGFSLGLGI